MWAAIVEKIKDNYPLWLTSNWHKGYFQWYSQKCFHLWLLCHFGWLSINQKQFLNNRLPSPLTAAVESSTVVLIEIRLCKLHCKRMGTVPFQWFVNWQYLKYQRNSIEGIGNRKKMFIIVLPTDLSARLIT